MAGERGALRPFYVHERADQVYIDFGLRVNAARKRLNWTQKELAQRIGLTRASVANIECGRQRLLLHTFLELTEQLQLSVNGALGIASSEALFVAPAPSEQVERIKQHIADYTARQIERFRA